MLHRSIMKHWLWDDAEKFKAWLYFIFRAAQCETKITVGAEVVTLERGSFLTSFRDLMKEFGWSNRKLMSFLDSLEAEQMVSIKTHRKGTHKSTHISITNFDTYHNLSTADAYTKAHTDAPQAHTQRKRRKPVDKSVDNFVKMGVHMRMTQEELDKLMKEYGNARVRQEIPKADEWIQKADTKNAAKYRREDHNHYLFFRGWLDRRQSSAPARNIQPNGFSSNFQHNLDLISKYEESSDE